MARNVRRQDRQVRAGGRKGQWEDHPTRHERPDRRENFNELRTWRAKTEPLNSGPPRTANKTQAASTEILRTSWIGKTGHRG